MSSTYTQSDGLELMAVGDQPGTWGVTLNNNFSLIDQSLDSVVFINISTGSYNLNVASGALSNGRCRVIIFEGSPSGAFSVSVTPINIGKVYWIVNQTGQSLSMSNGSGTSLTIAANTTAPAFCDGNGNVVGLQVGNNSFSDINVSGTLTVGTQANLPAGANVNVGSQTLTAFIQALIPTLTSLPGNLVISGFNTVTVSGGFYFVFTFGTTAGTRVVLGFGFGTTTTSGFSIPLPGGFGFVGTQQLAMASLQAFNAVSGSVSAANVVYNQTTKVITFNGLDTGSNTPGFTASWHSICWANNF